MANYVEIKTNIPEIVVFKYGNWKKWENEGKNGKYIKYSIGVENRGEDKYLSVYENEYKKYFEPLGNMQDREVEILKYEDGKYKSWKLLEKGIDITPGSTNVPKQAENPATGQNEAKNDHAECHERFEKMLVAFKKLENRLEALETLKEGEALKLHKTLAGTSKTIESVSKELSGTVEKEWSKDAIFPTKPKI